MGSNGLTINGIIVGFNRSSRVFLGGAEDDRKNMGKYGNIHYQWRAFSWVLPKYLGFASMMFLPMGHPLSWGIFFGESVTVRFFTSTRAI
jgi:hypothetical protein